MDILPRGPAPELERLLANTPASRELRKLRDMAIELSDSTGMLVMIQMKLADLPTRLCQRRAQRKRASYLDRHTVS